MLEVTTVAEAVNWERNLDTLMTRIAPRFCRVEARRQACPYVAGLLAPLESNAAIRGEDDPADWRPNCCR